MLRKGDRVRILPLPPVEPRLREATGVITGFRPDGLVVVRLSTGARAPFRREELAAEPGSAGGPLGETPRGGPPRGSP